MKQLVVYFSHTGENMINYQIKVLTKGNTEVVAEKIAALTGADFFKIQPTVPYPTTYIDCNNVSRVENETNRCPDIINPLASIADYDVIYIGFPIWHRSFPAIISKFIRSYDFSGKTVMPFCTNDEGGFGTAEMELRAILRNSNVKNGLAIHGSKVHKSDDVIAKWVIK